MHPAAGEVLHVGWRYLLLPEAAWADLLEANAPAQQLLKLQTSCPAQGILYVDRMLSRSFAARGAGTRLPADVPRPGPCSCCHPIDAVGQAQA